MTPNHLRPDEEAQGFIAKAINALGFEPFRKPTHLYSLDELRAIRDMYKEIKEAPCTANAKGPNKNYCI